MKIGFLCHDNCGGSNRIAVGMATYFAGRGHQVHLFSRTRPLIAFNISPDVTLHPLFPNGHSHQPPPLKVHWPSVEIEAMIRLIQEVIDKSGLDVLHVHYALPFARIALEIRDRMKKERPVLIATLHGSDVSLYGQDQEIAPGLTRILNRFDMLTTVSENHARMAVQVLGLNSKPQLISNFLDLNHFSSEDHRPSNVKPIILHISNFGWIKNFPGVIEIYKAIREKVEAELWLISNAEVSEIIQVELIAQNLTAEVRYFGFQRDVVPFMRQSDLLIMPSRLESFCMAAMEAMACGLPVLASDVGGLPEVVLHGKTGFLFPFGHYGTAAGYALRLLSDHDLYRSMSLDAINHAHRFDQKKIVPLYENLYHHLIRER